MMLGRETKKEIELNLDGISPAWAANGFYTGGEIGPLDSSVEDLQQSRFHNTALILCAF